MTTAQLHKFLAIKVMGWRHTVRASETPAFAYKDDNNGTATLVRDWAPTAVQGQALMILNRCLDLQPHISVSKFPNGTYWLASQNLVGRWKASTLPLVICRFAHDIFASQEKPWKPLTTFHFYVPNTFDGLCAHCDGKWHDKRHTRKV